MGFFNISMEKNILLHPAHFGPRMREILYERLRGEARALIDSRAVRAAPAPLTRQPARRRWRAPARVGMASWCW